MLQIFRRNISKSPNIPKETSKRGKSQIFFRKIVFFPRKLVDLRAFCHYTILSEKFKIG